MLNLNNNSGMIFEVTSLNSLIQSHEILYEQLTRIKCLARSSLSQIEFAFPNFTNHAIEHSESVIRILDELIFESHGEDFLNEIEIYMLLAAAYLHDVGMASSFDQNQSQNLDLIYIRDNHHDLSAQILKKYSQETKNLLGQHDYILHCDDICKVIRGHRIVNLQSKEYDNTPYGIKIVRLRLIASLFRLADELDIFRYRVRQNIVTSSETSAEMKKSQLHHFKHIYVKGCKIENGSIEIVYGLPEDFDPRYLDLLDSLTYNKIAKVLEDVKLVFRQYGIMWDLVNSTYEVDTTVPKMPQDVLEIALQQYSESVQEERRQDDEEFRLITNQAITSGSVIAKSDPTSGVYNERRK